MLDITAMFENWIGMPNASPRAQTKIGQHQNIDSYCTILGLSVQQRRSSSQTYISQGIVPSRTTFRSPAVCRVIDRQINSLRWRHYVNEFCGCLHYISI